MMSDEIKEILISLTNHSQIVHFKVIGFSTKYMQLVYEYKELVESGFSQYYLTTVFYIENNNIVVIHTKEVRG